MKKPLANRGENKRKTLYVHSWGEQEKDTLYTLGVKMSKMGLTEAIYI